MDKKTPEIQLGTLKAPAGSRHSKKRLGRGTGSGLGKTSGRGHKGHRARTGGKAPGHEGGQMPLIRLFPKRGFRPLDAKRWCVVNVGELERFPAGGRVDPAGLREARLVRSVGRIKILADGELKHPLTVVAHAFSASARRKIETAGGRAEVLAPAPPGAPA